MLRIIPEVDEVELEMNLHNRHVYQMNLHEVCLEQEVLLLQFSHEKQHEQEVLPLQ